MAQTAHLHPLLLRSQRVDDSDPPGFRRQQSHLIASVPPPGLPDVSGPVGARAGGGHVHETPPGGVVPGAVGLWIHTLLDLWTDTRKSSTFNQVQYRS